MSTVTARLHFSGLEIDLSHTMPEVIAYVANVYGDKPFCVSETGETTSFADFERKVISLGARLIKTGVKPGDRIAIWAPNSPEWIVAACAIECIGAIMIPINTRFKGLEARYVLEKSRARILFTVREFLGADYVAMLRDACGGPGENVPCAELEHLEHIVNLDVADVFSADISGEDETIYRKAASAVTPETIIDILFTSGTTGMPKGAMHNHAQAIWMSALYNEANDYRASDKAAIVNPFFHSFGYRAGWVAGLIAGQTIYPLATFDPAAMLRLINDEKITVLAGAPAVFFSLMNHKEFKSYDISSLRCGHTGGAKTPPDIILAGYERLGFDIFLTSYGQTESTAMISTNRAGDPLEAIIKTVGRPIPDTDVRIVNNEGKDQPVGESGELWVRGPTVMQGYFEDPDQTAATVDKDGWLHTGDVACLDDEGRLRILDRIKDVVIVGGFNAYPVEIEIMLAAHPALQEVAIIGLPDDRMGEVTAACVILKPGASLSLEELTAWSRERMANYKVPRRLFIYDDFPRTPLGKVQKFKLRNDILAERNA